MDIHETIIKKLNPHPFYHLVFYFSGAGIFVAGFFFNWYLGIVGMLVGSLVFVLGEVSRRAETFYVLETGIAREYKLLTTSREFAEYGKIQNIKVRQSFIENMLGIGNIHIDTAGGERAEVNFHGVVDPYGIEHIIREKMKIQ
jgi:uncharacterized membrane protein YdbT with pleckstrin-like domain